MAITLQAKPTSSIWKTRLEPYLPLMRWLVIALIVVALLFLGAWAWQSSQTRALDSAHSDLTNAQAQLAAEKSQHPDVVLLSQKKNFAQSLLGSRPQVTALLHLFEQKLLTVTQLTDMTMPSSTSMTISGKTPSYRDVAKQAIALEQSDAVTAVQIRDLKQSDSLGVPVIEFTFDLTIDPAQLSKGTK